MEDIKVKINRRTREVNPKQIFIGADGENLQGNIIFSFEDEFVEGQARLDIEFRDGTKGQITELNQVGETYVLPIKSEITKYSGCIAQLVIDEGTDENSIPIFKSLFVGLIVAESINATTKVPERYTEWIDSANAKLNQIDEKIEEVDTAVEQVNNAVERVDEGLSDLTRANEEAREIVSNFEDNVENYTSDFNTNAENKTSTFNSNYETKLSSFNSNASERTTEYDNNANSKLSAYNENADSKLSSYNTNANSKLNTYNSNASTKTSEYNTNATSKLNEYNTNAETKLSNYNTNASDKLDSYNSNADSKLDEYNTNASTKLDEYNQNASEKIEEYDNHVAEMQNTIDKLEDRVDDLEDNQIKLPAEGTEIHVEDAAKARLYEFEMEKESTQETTTGKNLYGGFTFNKTNNGVTFNYDIDGTISANGISTAIALSMYSGDAKSNNFFKTLTAGTYTISGGKSNVIIEVINSSGIVIATTTSSVFTKTFTINSETQVFVRLKIENGITLNNEKIYQMLEQDSTATNWEPHTGGQPSPNPDYPQEVKTVEGYRNLFDKDNVQWYRNNHSAFINTSNSSTVRIRTTSFSITGGKTYTVSGIPSEVTFNGIRTYEEYGGENTSDNTRTGNTITLGANVKYIHLLFSGSDFTDETNELMANANICIAEGTEEKPYVPYGNNYILYKQVGKNLCNDVFETGSISTTTGENTTATMYKRTEKYTSVLPNTTYTFNIYQIEQQIVIFYYNDTNFLNFDYLNNVSQITFTTPNNCTNIRARVQTTNTINNIQLEEGTTATTYEPYKETIVPLPLNGNEIAGKGNYLDEYIVDKNGHCWLEKNYLKYIFTGNETIQKASSTLNNIFQYLGLNATILTPPNNNSKIGMLSNCFIENDVNSFYNSNLINIGVTKSGTINIGIGLESGIDTVEKFKDYLQILYQNGTPLELWYPLATPQPIDLNTTVDLKLFKGVNNITNSEDGNMRIRYVESIESVISELRNAILEIGGGE